MKYVTKQTVEALLLKIANIVNMTEDELKREIKKVQELKKKDDQNDARKSTDKAKKNKKSR